MAAKTGRRNRPQYSPAKAQDSGILNAEILPCAVFTVDKQRNIKSWNKQAEKITGYKARDVLGKKCTCFADEPCKQSCGLFSHNLKNPILEKRCTIKTKTGRMKTIQKNADYLRDEKGKIIGGIEVFIDIDNEIKANNELKKFKQVSENASYGMAITDLKGNIQYINDYFAKIHGYGVKELIDRNISIFHTKKELKQVNEFNKKLLQQKPYSGFEVMHKHKNGKEFPMIMSGVLIKDTDGKPIGMAATAIDISEQKKHEKELEEKQSIIEQIQDSIIVTDVKGKITYANQTASELMGKHTIGKHVTAFARSKAEKELQKKIIKDTLRKGHWKGEVPNYDKEGNKIIFHSRTLLLKDKKGRPNKLVGVSIDQTQQKISEQKIRESEERFRKYIEYAPDAIWVSDSKGRYLEVNSAAAEITGYTKEELVKMSISDIIPADWKQEGINHFLKVKKQGKAIGTCPYQRKDKEIRWWRISAVKLDKDRYMAFTQDITELKRSEEEIKKRNEELEQMNKLAVGRELHMIKLKEEIHKLKGK